MSLKKQAPMKQISVRISAEQLAYLESNGLNLSMVVRHALAQFIKKHSKGGTHES